MITAPSIILGTEHIMQASRVAADLYRDLMSGSPRRDLQRRRWDLMGDNVDGHIETEVARRFNEPQTRRLLQQFRDVSNNSYRAIIDKISTVFKEPPARSFTLKSDELLWYDVVDVDDLNLVMEQVNRIVMSLNECLTVPVLRDGKVQHDVVTPDTCEVHAEGREARALLYFVDDDTLVFVDEWLRQVYDRAGNARGPAMLHGAGRLPVNVYRRQVPVKGFWLGLPGEDLVALYFAQVIYRSWLEVIAYYQAHKELARKPTADQFRHGTNPTKTQAGPHVVHDGEYEVLDLRTDIEPHLRVAEAKLSRAASNYGISADVLNQGKFGSGLERLLSHSTLNEVRLSTIKVFRPIDKRSMLLDCQIWNAGGLSDPGRLFSEDPRPTIDYGEPRLIESHKDKQELLKASMETGTASPIDYILDGNPDLRGDRAKARQILERNLEESGWVLEARRSFAVPQAAAVADGVDGGEASGKARAVLGHESDKDDHTSEGKEQ